MKFKRIISMILCCVMLMSLTISVNAAAVTIPTDNLTVNTGTIHPRFAIAEGTMVYSYTVTNPQGGTVISKEFNGQLYGQTPSYGSFVASYAGKYKITWTIGGASLVQVMSQGGYRYSWRPNNTNVHTYYQTFTVVGDTIESPESPKVSFTSQTFVYDGTEKYIEVKNVPSGGEVRYNDSGYTGDKTPFKTSEVGRYKLEAYYRSSSSDDLWRMFMATLTILPKELHVSDMIAENKNYDGTDNATITGGSISSDDIISGDEVIPTFPTTGTFASANAGNDIGVSFSPITLSGADAKNYKIIQPTLKADINKLPIAIKANDIRIAIGDDIPALTYTITEDNFVGTDKETGELATTAKSNIEGDYDITQGTLTVSDNYELTFTNGTLSVVDKTPQNVVVSAIPSTKTYGDTGFKIDVIPDTETGLTEIEFSSSNTDVATVDNEGNVVIKNAGTTTIEVFQAGDDTYAPFRKTQTLTVNKMPITVTANNTQKRVNTADPADLTYTYTGTLVDGDNFIGKLERTSGETVGVYDINQGTLTLSNNYDITFVKGTFEILDKEPQNIVLSEIPSTTTYGDAGFVIAVESDTTPQLGDVSYVSSNTDVATIDSDGNVVIKNAGTTTITVSRAGNDDYAPFTTTQVLSVNKMAITVTADNAQKRVNTADPADLTYTYTGTLVDGDDFIGKLERTSGETVGVYDINQGTLTLGNNYDITFVKGTFEILDKEPQNIVLSEIPSTKTYGDAGFVIDVESDTTPQLGDVSYVSSNTDVATIDSDGNVVIENAGTTTITVSRAGNDDYSPFAKSQLLTVNKMPITVTANNAQKRVNTADPADLTYTYTGTLVDDDEFTGKLERASGETVGVYDINQGTLTLGNNYDITFVKGTFEILEKNPQTITIDDIPAKIYGDADFHVTVTKDSTSNLENFTYSSSNEAVAVIDTIGKVTIKGVGETEISVTEAGNEDYAQVTAKKILTVAKAPLNIKLDNISITYGDTMPEYIITYTGFIDGEDKTVLTVEPQVNGMPKKVNAGEYDLTVSGAEAANYEITYENAKLTVAKKALSIATMNVFDKAVDETTTATINTSSITFNGLVSGDDVKVDTSVIIATFDDATVGDNKVVSISNIAIIGNDASNYELSDTTLQATGNIKDSITATDIAAQISAPLVEKNAETLTLPEVPEGYEIAIKSSDDETVISLDGKIAPTTEDKTVKLVLTVKNTADEADTADTAEFTVTIPTSDKVTATVTAEANGTVTGGGEHPKNSEVTVTAKANSGYKFSGWYNGETSVSTSASYTFKATDDISLVAKFTKKTSSGGGGGGGSSVSSYTVKFETNGGNEIESVKVSRNKTIAEPTAPIKDGYTFDGWYTDKTLTTAYDFDTKVTKSFTLYAKWTENKEEEKPEDNKPEDTKPEDTNPEDTAPVETKNPFSDVNTDDWFYDAVMFAYENKITSGVSVTAFAPQGKVTRGQFITMLCRAYEIPEMTGDNFDDCGDTWYTGYLSAAKQLGISIGVGDNKFAPEKEITREEMVTLIYNYLKSIDKAEETVHEISFADKDMISEWAKSAVAFASSTGYVNGKDNNIFDPQGTATRAELAQIFYNIFANIN